MSSPWDRGTIFYAGQNYLSQSQVLLRNRGALASQRFSRVNDFAVGVLVSKLQRGFKCWQMEIFFSSWIQYYASRGLLCFLIVSSFVHCHGCKENIFKSLRIKLNSSQETFFLLNIIRTFVREGPWHSVRTPPHKLENFLEADFHMLDDKIYLLPGVVFS